MFFKNRAKAKEKEENISTNIDCILKELKILNKKCDENSKEICELKMCLDKYDVIDDTVRLGVSINTCSGKDIISNGYTLVANTFFHIYDKTKVITVGIKYDSCKEFIDCYYNKKHDEPFLYYVGKTKFEYFIHLKQKKYKAKIFSFYFDASNNTICFLRLGDNFGTFDIKDDMWREL